MNNLKVLDSLTADGLLCPYNQMLMGACAEKTVTKYGITREEQDDYCVLSYQRTTAAWERGFFKNEVEPVEVLGKKGRTVVSEDEEFRKVKYEKIRGLKPVFAEGGTITPANASKINDGACAVIMMSASRAKALGCKPLARVLGFADYETEPLHFSIAPYQAILNTLAWVNIEIGKVDLFEINEAFSAVALANMKLLGIKSDIVNVNGGAVALGHPVGMSGARIVSTLIYALRERNKSIGVAAICNGGGGATALALEVI